MRECISIDYDWEDYLHGGSRAMSEDEWWDHCCESNDRLMEEANQAAINSSDLWEFDSEDERDEYITDYITDFLASKKGR